MGPALWVDPPVPGMNMRPVTTMKGVKVKGNCLERAEAIAKQSPGRYEVVTGLVEDGERMWPHAWLLELESRIEYDPTLPDAEHHRYIEFPRGAAGEAYVKLLGGQMQVMRGINVYQQGK